MIVTINAHQWVVVEQSCSAYSRVVVPLYDTLGKEAVTHIINQGMLVGTLSVFKIVN